MAFKVSETPAITESLTNPENLLQWSARFRQSIVNAIRDTRKYILDPGNYPVGGTVVKVDSGSDLATADFQDGGDINFTEAAGVVTAAIKNNTVTYAKMQDVTATSRFLGRITAGAGDPEELTGTQATSLLDLFTSGLKGLAPASGGGTTNFLRADGTWAAPPGGGGGDAITINTVAVSDADFNNTTPAPPAGSQNVLWQRSGTGPDSVSAYPNPAAAYTWTAAHIYQTGAGLQGIVLNHTSADDAPLIHFQSNSGGTPEGVYLHYSYTDKAFKLYSSAVLEDAGFTFNTGAASGSRNFEAKLGALIANGSGQSSIASGLIVNGSAGGLASDDLEVNSNTVAAILLVDASLDVVRIGGATNYAQFASGGNLTFAGTAQLNCPVSDLLNLLPNANDMLRGSGSGAHAVITQPSFGGMILAEDSGGTLDWQFPEDIVRYSIGFSELTAGHTLANAVTNYVSPVESAWGAATGDYRYYFSQSGAAGGTAGVYIFKVRILVITNNMTSNGSFTLMKDGVATSISTTVTAGVTGWFTAEDTGGVHFSETEGCNIRIVNGGSGGGNKDLDIQCVTVEVGSPN